MSRADGRWRTRADGDLLHLGAWILDGKGATGECGEAGTTPCLEGWYDDPAGHVSAPPSFGIWLLSPEHRQGSRRRLPSGRALPEAPVRPATSTLQGEHAKR